MTDVDSMPAHQQTAADQAKFAQAVYMVIRAERRRQKLTQAELAKKTNGLVQKASLANYETGHRSLRIDVVWVLAEALGTTISELMALAEKRIRQSPSYALKINGEALEMSTDPLLRRILRWHILKTGRESLLRNSEIMLDPTGVTALATYMQMDETSMITFLDGHGLLVA